MKFLGVLARLLLLCHPSLAFPVPVDTIIVQAQQWGVVGAPRVEDLVLLNGVSLSGTSQEFTNIKESISTDALLLSLIGVNQTSVLMNHTVLRSRECILEGSELHWTDRVFYDGKVYLSLDRTDTWRAHVPQALATKGLWDREEQRTRQERIRLEHGCIKLMRELKLSGEQSGAGIPLPQVLIPILALLAFTGLILTSLLLSKKAGLRHPGGVLGSVIHYPKDMTEMGPEKKGNGYHTL